MMYKISHHITNCFPQIQEYHTSSELINIEEFENDGNKDKKIILPIFVLDNKANMTDLISSVPLASSSLIISSSLKLKLLQFKLANHKFYDIKFVHKNNLISNYFAIKMLKNPDYLNSIDWEKSRFFKTTHWHEKKHEEFKFKNWTDMVEFEKNNFQNNKEYGFLYDLRIKIDDSYDLLNYRYFGFPEGFICSERLKTCIEDEGFSGFEFSPINNG
jgi:hypothetical protein